VNDYLSNVKLNTFFLFLRTSDDVCFNFSHIPVLTRFIHSVKSKQCS